MCCLMGNFCLVTELVIESKAMRWSRQMAQLDREQGWQPGLSVEQGVVRGLVLIKMLPRFGVRRRAVKGGEGSNLLIFVDF